MAARRNGQSHSRAAYVHGNAVRKLEPERVPVRRTKADSPLRERPAEREERRPAVNHKVRRNREKALQMDLPYVIALTIAAVCTLCLCVNYLHLQSSITSRIHEIEKLETNLETLKTENDALQTSINTSVDLDHVYKVATEELGMVYANKNQILQYEKTESEYVRQNEDIPKR